MSKLTRKQIKAIAIPELVNPDDHVSGDDTPNFKPFIGHHDGSFTFRRTFYYRHGLTTLDWIDTVTDFFEQRGYAVDVLDSGEQRNDWPKDSFWFVKINIIEIEDDGYTKLAKTVLDAMLKYDYISFEYPENVYQLDTLQDIRPLTFRVQGLGIIKFDTNTKQWSLDALFTRNMTLNTATVASIAARWVEAKDFLVELDMLTSTIETTE